MQVALDGEQARTTKTQVKLMVVVIVVFDIAVCPAD